MTGITSDVFADTPGPDATPEQDADVRALLGALRDADVPMPADVWTRLSAVIAEEQRTAGATGSAAGIATDDTDGSALVPGMAPVTVLPTAEERQARTSGTTLRWLAGAAAAVVIVGGAYGVVRGLAASSSAVSTAGAASTAPENAASAGTVVTASGTAYTSAGLPAQAKALVASSVGQPTAVDQKDQITPEPGAASGAPTGTRGPTSAYAASLAAQMPRDAALTQCIDELSGAPGTKPLALDVGTYDGKPALVVVLPSTDDPASLDVIVVPVDCSSSDFVQLVRVPRP